MSLKIPAEFTGLEKSAEIAAKKAGRNLKINLGTSARSVDALSQPLGRITGKADEFTKSMEAANARVLAFGASVGVLTAVTQAFKDIVTVTIQVEKQMASINAILGASSGELSKFKKEIFDVARNTEQSFDTVSTAALELSRQGLSATEVVKRLNDALILSRLSGQSSADAVAGLTSAINGFKKAGITSAQVVNKFSEAAKSAAVSERDLAEAFKRAGAVAGQAGVSFDELVGIVSAVQEKTSRGGAVIGNSFKTIFTRIQSLDKLKTMQELGVQVTDTTGQILSATDIIKNLAGVLENFPDARRLQIAEGLVGKFQVAPFISILEDYNDETSKAIKITEISSRATTAAYERNEALNKTLSAAINEVTVNLSQLGDMLGKIGVTDSLKNVLGFFNSMVEGLKGLLDEETGSNIAKGLVKGIGNVISGPGLAVFAAVIGKLTLDLVKFGTGSLKTFFGLNRAAKEQATLQGQIASTLLNNKGVQEAILKIERSSVSAEEKKAQQTKFFTTALNEQFAIMQKMQGIAARVAPGVRAGTGRGAFGRGAGGYIPNFAGGSVVGSEQADINRGVGGAPPSARPVSIPNFNFGGGQRGTMVANNSEFIVPNFGGGSAIFNQNMAASMGLPAGARPVGAAGGYIPNFAKTSSGTGTGGRPYSIDEIVQASNPSKLKNAASLMKGNSRTAATLAYTDKDPKILAAKERLKQAGGMKTFISTGKTPGNKGPYVMLVPQTGVRQNFTHSFKNPRGQFSSFRGRAYGIKSNLKGDYEKFTGLEKEIDKSLAGAANKVVKFLSDDINLKPSPVTASNLDSLISSEGGPGAIGALKGAMFESITNAVIDAQKTEKQGSLDIDFRPNRKLLEIIFGLPKNRFKFGDYKSSMNSKSRYVDQVMIHDGAFVRPKKGKAASGYIPNFVGNLENAIGREAAAGVPINQIRVNQKGSLRNAGNPMGLAVTNTRDEPTGAIPNFFNRNMGALNTPANMKMAKNTEQVAKGFKEVATANRDMLGTIFAVQMGLSLLTGATADAEGGIGRFVNRLSSGLSTATTGALAGSALSTFGDSFSESSNKFTRGFGKVTKGLGTLGTVVGVSVGAFQIIKGAIDDATGKTDANALAMAQLADSAKKAAFSLDDLSEVQKLKISQEAEDFPTRLIKAISKQNPGASLNLGMLSKDTAKEQFINLRAQGFNEEAIIKLFAENITSEIRQVNAKLTPEQAAAGAVSGNRTFLTFTKKNLAEISQGTSDMTSKAAAFFESLKDLTDSQKTLLMEKFGDTEGRGELRGPRRAGVNNPLKDIDPVLLKAGNIGIDPAKIIQKFTRGFIDSFKTPGKEGDIDRTPIEIAKGFLSRTAQNRLIQQAGTISPEEMSAARGGAGLLFPGQRVGATTALNKFNFQEKAVSNFIDGIADVITKTDDIDTTTLDDPNSPFRRAVDNLMGIKFADIATMEGKQAVMQSFITTANLTELQKNQLTVIADKIQKQQKGLEIDLAAKNANTKLNDELSKGNALVKARVSAAERLRKGDPQFKADTEAGFFNRLSARSEVKFLEDTRDAQTILQQLEANESRQLRDTLIDASSTFAQNISDGLVDAIVQGKSLKDTLVSAATDFFTMMSKAYMKQAVDSIVGGGGGGNFLSNILFKAGGGMVRGGSGNKDDVPALLTGGEFVMKKSSVKKFGPGFMNAINEGAVPRFANGGMFIPGSFGQGAISGKQNLLNFATQTGTSGAFDRFGGGAGFASIALAPESLSLTNLGRSLSPAFKRTQGAKRDAFDLFVQQLNADEQRKEQERALAQAKKERRRGLFASLGLAAGGALLSGAFGAGGIFGGRKTSGLESNITAADLGGKSASALPPGLGGAKAPRALPVLSMGNVLKKIKNFLPPLPSFFEGGRTASDALFNDQGGADPFHHKPFIGPLEEAVHMNPHMRPMGGMIPYMRPMGGMIPYMAGGGGVPYAAGVDTVPAMLSGGEFVMNAGATQRIGAGNLETLNAGGGFGGASSTSITKGDTNISIVVNSDGGEKEESSGSANQEDQNLAVRLKDAVRDVLSQEKRLGGMLRV